MQEALIEAMENLPEDIEMEDAEDVGLSELREKLCELGEIVNGQLTDLTSQEREINSINLRMWSNNLDNPYHRKRETCQYQQDLKFLSRRMAL